MIQFVSQRWSQIMLNSWQHLSLVVQCLVAAWIDAIEAQPKAAHVHLSLGEVLDASAIVDMAQNLVVESSLQLVTAL